TDPGRATAPRKRPSHRARLDRRRSVRRARHSTGRCLMPPRKRKPLVVVDIGRWTVELTGPVRHTVPIARRVCGSDWTYQGHSRTVRVTVQHAADVVAALEQAKVPHAVNGSVPQPELWS